MSVFLESLPNKKQGKECALFIERIFLTLIRGVEIFLPLDDLWFPFHLSCDPYSFWICGIQGISHPHQPMVQNSLYLWKAKGNTFQLLFLQLDILNISYFFQDTDHYICTQNGTLVCLPGWSVESELCTVPTCNPECVFHQVSANSKLCILETLGIIKGLF